MARNRGTQAEAPTKEATSGGAQGATGAPAALDVRIKQLGELRREVLLGLSHVIVEAAQVEVIGAVQEGSAGLKLILSIDGEEVVIAAASVEIVEGDLAAAIRKAKGRRGRYNRIKRPEALTIKELHERNLPLYWNEQWLRQELQRLGSYAEIARVHGYPSAVTIASYAKRKFGISVQDDYDRKRQAVYQDFDTGDYTHLELADRNGVGVATVYRWLQQRREDKAHNERRATQPQPGITGLA